MNPISKSWMVSSRLFWLLKTETQGSVGSLCGYKDVKHVLRETRRRMVGLEVLPSTPSVPILSSPRICLPLPPSPSTFQIIRVHVVIHTTQPVHHTPLLMSYRHGVPFLERNTLIDLHSVIRWAPF